MTARYLPLVAKVRRVDDRRREIETETGMAESLFSRILGEEDEKPVSRGEGDLAGADASRLQ